MNTFSMPPRRFRLCALAATLGCLQVATNAQTQAQPPAETQAQPVQTLDVVTVTARKREERGQDVPQSLNVFSGAALEASGISTVDQLQYRTPGVSAVSGPANQISIRGVNNNASQRGGGPSTAAHLDGVYLPRPELATSELYDLNRVEVLKGPEGTLYGRNATAGVINFVTQDPRENRRFDGYLGAGSYGLRRAEAGLNISAGESAAFRISATSVKDSGYTENLDPAGGRLDARDYQSARLKGVFQITPNIDAKVTVQFSDDHGTSGYGVSENPATPNFVNSLNPPQRASVRKVQVDMPPDVHRQGTIVSAQVGADLGSGLTLKSITGYVGFTSRNRYDADGTGGFIEYTQGADKSSFLSQEFQLSGGSEKSLAWTTGLYFSREKTSGSTLVQDSNFYPVDLTPFIFETFGFSGKASSAAVFGEASYALSDKWTIVGGARYTRERMSGSSSGGDIDFDTFTLIPFAGSESTTSGRFTPKLLLQYKPNTDQMFYASVTSGFKSGGINFNPPVKTYKPEKITAYEVGTKNVLAGGALEFDLAGFVYDYTDLQLRTVVGHEAPISNVAKASVKGLEFAVVGRPTRELTIDANAAYVDSQLKSYVSPATGTDLSGMPLPLSPRFSGTLGAQYRLSLGGGSLTARAEVNRQGGVIFPALQDPSFERRDAVTLVNANVRYDFPGKHTYVALIGRNLTNRTYLSNRNYSVGFADIETYAPPRTLELRLGTQF